MSLAKYGVICSQEVSRTSDHMPSKTWFLWRFSDRQLLQNVKKNLLHAMKNLYEVIQIEYANNALLIAKTQRLDVRENPSLLGESERENLKQFYSVVNKLEFHFLALIQEYFVLSEDRF